MYELIRVSDSCYYIQSPAKIGLVKTGDGEVCLIDSGSDKDAGKKVLRHLEENDWVLKAIYNTHSNADHIGGNRYLQNRTGCAIYAPGIECDMTNHPLLEPSFLYGGYPFKDLKHKFLMAQESTAMPLTEDVLPEGFEIVPLPGHFFDMVGFRTPDDVVYIADCLSSRETIQKYRIGFIYDVASYIDTLERVCEMKAKLFIPAHAEPSENLSELARYNIEKTLEIGDMIEDICGEPACFEQVLKKLACLCGIELNYQQYVLVGSTVRSYLSWLKDGGRLDCRFEDNMLLWHRPQPSTD